MEHESTRPILLIAGASVLLFSLLALVAPKERGPGVRDTGPVHSVALPQQTRSKVSA